MNPNEVLIGDHTPIDHPDTNAGMKGCVPRDYGRHPVGTYAPPSQIKLIPRSEWKDRIAAMTANKSRISDVRRIGNNGAKIPSLDQGQVGYCWAHSTTQGVHMVRAIMNQPYVPLSAYSVAATIKNGADEGAWGALSMDFIQARGVWPQSLWPQGDRKVRSPGDPGWVEAKKYIITDGWEELGSAVYDRNMSFDQAMTLMMVRTPTVLDFNWWSHSVLGIDPVDGNVHANGLRNDSGKLATPSEIEAMLGVGTATDGFCIRILNSWGDVWSDNGMGVLSGSKAIPDGAVAPSNVLAI